MAKTKALATRPPIDADSAGLYELKAVTSRAPWTSATVTTGEAVRRHRRVVTDADETTRRANGVVLAVTMRISQDVAGCRLRLYRPEGSGGKRGRMYRSRRVTDRKRLEWLHGPAVGKAAINADEAGDVEEVFDHPLLDLLNRPNPWQRGSQFIRLTSLYRLIAGRAFWQKVVERGGGGLPVELLMMAPQHTEVIPDAANLIGGYLYGRESMRQQFFTPEEVTYHQHTPSLFDPYNAIGPLHAVHQDADLIAAAALSEIHRWENESRPDWYAEIDAQSGDKAEDVREAIEAQLRGVNKRGRILVGKLLKIIPLGFAPKDMEYQSGRKIATDDILAAYGYPESMYRLNDANLASSRTGHTQYQRFTILPEIAAIAEAITEDLCPHYAERGQLWVAPDNPVSEDIEAKARTQVLQVNAGLRTYDEARAEDGLDPLPDGLGEIPRFNGVPLDMIGKTPTFGFGQGRDQAAGAGALPAGETPETEQDAAVADAATKQDIETAEDLVLNGAQITAATAIVTAVAAGEMPRGAGIGQLEVLFNLTTEQAERIMGDAGTDTPTTPNPRPLSEQEQAAIDAQAQAGQKPPGGPEKPQEPAEGDKAVFTGPFTPAEFAGDLMDDIRTWARDAGHPHTSLPWSKWVWGGPLPRTKDDDLARRRIRATEAQLDAALRAWFRAAIPQLVAQAAADFGAGPVTISNPDLLTQLVSAIDEPMTAALEKGIEEAIAELPEGDLDPDELTRAAREVLEGEKVKLADQVMNSAEERIRLAMSEGVREGETVEQLQERVADTVSREADFTSERIARTETRRAFMEGRRETWKQSSVVVGRRWILSPDPCPVCQAIAREHPTTSLTEPFVPLGGVVGGMTVGFRAVEGGDAHPNCSCSVAPILEGDE